MKKLKRILSAILIAAMALSLMPTFASAEVGDTYTYHFNPNGVETTYTTSTHTWETIKTMGTTPWALIGCYGLNGTTYPIGKKWSNGNLDMYVVTKTSTHGYVAFKLQVPESGTYSAKLTATLYSASGEVNVYLLPGDMVLKYDGTDSFASEYKLNISNENLNISRISATSTTYDYDIELANSVEVSEMEHGEYGAGKILVIESASFATGKSNNFVYIDSFSLTKEEDLMDDTTVKHTVTFNANNGTTDTKTQDIAENTATPLTENSFTKEGYEFNGWNTQADGKGTAYADKAEVTLTGGLTLYAQWKLAPITLTFNNTTASNTESGAFNAFSAAEGQNFSFVADKSSSTTGGSSAFNDYGLLMNTLRASGSTGINWLAADKTEDEYAGMLTISANDIPAGTYEISAGVHNFTRGAGVYYYVNGEYVGFDDAYAETGKFNDKEITTEETIGYITIDDSDNDSSTANPVEISICSAAIDYETNANLYVLRSITFTPVDEIPAYGDLTYEVTGATAVGDGYTVENNTTLSLTAMLSGKHLNGYTLDGTKDNNNYIKVSSSDESIVSVTDTEAALDSAEIYASGYKPVYTLTAHKSNASATITVEAIVDGNSVASKTFTVSVAKSDADTYEPSATFAWGTTLPSVLVADNVTVAEKDGEAVSAGEIKASKGTTYTLSATPEVTDGDTTYKFIGWKRGATSDGAAAFIGYEVEDEYTVWSNTYLTAAYEEITTGGEKCVEFYDQDRYYLGYMTESQLKTNGLPANNPKLLGHTFSKWQYVDATGETKEFTADTELTESVTRVVALQTPAQVTITYKNENDEEVVTKTYAYNEEVNALTDSEISKATYWTILAGDAEKTVRTSNGYSFYAWANATIKGYTGAVTEKLPKVVLHDTPRDDSYMIEYDRYSGSYTVVEAGILLGNADSISLLSCEKKYTSAKGGRAHGQFAAPHENYDYVRGYIIYKTNSTGALSVVYTDTVATEK